MFYQLKHFDAKVSRTFFFFYFRKTLGAHLGRNEVIDYCKFDLKIPKSKQKNKETFEKKVSNSRAGKIVKIAKFSDTFFFPLPQQ